MNRRPSHLDNEQCRSCSSFSDYIKSTKKKNQDENGNIVGGSAEGKDKQQNGDHAKTRRTDCPLDKDLLGSYSWGLLHTMAAKYSEQPSSTDKCDMKSFFRILGKFYPCKPCSEDLREELKIDPPQVESQEELSQWLCRLHNKVNVKLGKPVFDCTQVNQRWRDGWLDGSCDS